MQRKLSSSVRVFYPEFNREEIISRIKQSFAALQEKLTLRLVVLFGSYSKGNYTVASDIDLLIVYKGRARKDAYSICRKTVGIPRLEPHMYSESEYEEMKQTVDKMIKDGVVLLSERE